MRFFMGDYKNYLTSYTYPYLFFIVDIRVVCSVQQIVHTHLIIFR